MKHLPFHTEAIRVWSSDVSKDHLIQNHRLFFELSIAPNVLRHIARTLPKICKKNKKIKRYLEQDLSFSLYFEPSAFVSIIELLLSVFNFKQTSLSLIIKVWFARSNPRFYCRTVILESNFSDMCDLDKR